MTSEQLNKILTTKSYDYKFVDRNSKDKIIISISGLGINHLNDEIINLEEFKEQGGSIFDVFEDSSILKNPLIQTKRSLFDFYNVFTNHPLCSDSDVLFLADSKWNHYLTGIDGIANNVQEIKDFVYALVTNKGYKTIYFAGTCSGAWMVALQALSLQILRSQVCNIKALLFNPLNEISKSGHFQIKTKKLLDEELTDAVNILEYQKIITEDNSEIIPLIHFVIYYSKLNDKNQEQSDMYRSMQNEKVKVDLYPVETREHNLARYLKGKNKLTDTLINFLR
jgi:hypothetical protein